MESRTWWARLPARPCFFTRFGFEAERLFARYPLILLRSPPPAPAPPSPERRHPSSAQMAACLTSTSAPSLSPSLRMIPSPFKGNLVHLRIASPSLLACRRGLSSTTGKPLVRCHAAPLATQEASPASLPERFRLNNLGPQPGSRKRSKRKGRGIAAGQGNSCGFGMRGQKSRSGPGVRKGFEGGQMPLYRRIPKLRGIAGGMHAGLPKFVPVNLKDIEAAGFQEGDEVSLESLKGKGVIKPSGRERRLPLKILAEGDLSVKLNIKARSFSAAAIQKLKAAGCSLTTLPGRKKWLKPSVVKNLARAEEYFAQKRAAVGAAAAAEADSGSA